MGEFLMKKKVLKATVATVLGAMLLSPGISFATEKTVYDLKKGKLVQKKTGKVVKGYAVYKGKLYKNGKSNKGYARVGTGASMKLYFNTALKKGYKTADHKKYLFKDGKLVKGYKQAAQNERLYKNGMLKSGYEVYLNQKGTQFLYFNGTLKKGLKTATRNNQTTLFKDGVVSQGNEVFKGKLYTDGQLNKAFTQVGDLFYNNGFLATGVIDGVEYANGVEVTPAAERDFNQAKEQYEQAEKAVKSAQADLHDLIALEKILNGEQSAKTLKMKAASSSEVAQFIADLRGQDLTKLTTDERKVLIDKIKNYKEATTIHLQEVIESYVVAAEKVSEASVELAKTTNSIVKAEEVQMLVANVQTAIMVLKESTKEITQIKIESAKLDKLLKDVEKALANNPVISSKPDEEKPAEPEEKPDDKPSTDNPGGTINPPINNGGSGNTGNGGSGNTGNGDSGNIDNESDLKAIKKQIQDLIDQITFNDESIKVKDETFWIVDEPEKQMGEKKYVSPQDVEILKMQVEEAKKALATSSISELDKGLNIIFRGIQEIQNKATSELIEDFKKEYSKLKPLDQIVTDNIDIEKLKPILTEKAQKRVQEGYSVEVNELFYSESAKQYLINYRLTKGENTYVPNYWHVLPIYTEKTYMDMFNSYKERAEATVIFNKKGELWADGDSIKTANGTYFVSESAHTQQKGKYITPHTASFREKEVNKYTAYFLEEYPNENRLRNALLNIESQAKTIDKSDWTNSEREELQRVANKINVAFLNSDHSTEALEAAAQKVINEKITPGFVGIVDEVSIGENENGQPVVLVTWTISKGNSDLTYQARFSAVIGNEQMQEELLEAAKTELAEAMSHFSVPTEAKDGEKIVIDGETFTISKQAEFAEGPNKYFNTWQVANLIETYAKAQKIDETTSLEEIQTYTKSLSYSAKNLKDEAMNKDIYALKKQAEEILKNKIVFKQDGITDIQGLVESEVKKALIGISDTVEIKKVYPYNDNEGIWYGLDLIVKKGNVQAFVKFAKVSYSEKTDATIKQLEKEKLKALLATIQLSSAYTVGEVLRIDGVNYILSKNPFGEAGSEKYIATYTAESEAEKIKAIQALLDDDATTIQSLIDAQEKVAQIKNTVVDSANNTTIFELNKYQNILTKMPIVAEQGSRNDNQLKEIWTQTVTPILSLSGITISNIEVSSTGENKAKMRYVLSKNGQSKVYPLKGYFLKEIQTSAENSNYAKGFYDLVRSGQVTINDYDDFFGVSLHKHNSSIATINNEVKEALAEKETLSLIELMTILNKYQ